MVSIYLNNVMFTVVGDSFVVFLNIGAIVFCMMRIFWEPSSAYGKNSERQSHGKKLSWQYGES
jgi:hypothetical protein